LFLDALKNLIPSTALLVLNHIPEESSCCRIIDAELSKRKWTYCKEVNICPNLFLYNQEYEHIQKGWMRSHRIDIKRQIKRLSQKGRLSLKLFNRREEAVSHFKYFLAMYEQRWKKVGSANPLSKDKRKDYYLNLVTNLTGKFLHFSALCLNDKPISYHIGFLYANRFYYYKPAFDIAYENFSPGKVHIAFLVKEGCNNKWKCIDFLRGDEPYKFNWTPQVIKTASFIVNPNKLWLRYKWQIRGKANAYRLFGKFYKKTRLVKETFFNLISQR
jgi:CelD/BcsL family acetyltransferase involved in cellulose biosynthesis